MSEGWEPRFPDQESGQCKHVIASTTNKGGLIDFMSGTIEYWRSKGFGTKIYSSGGTWRELHNEGHLIVHDMSELTGYEEVFGDLLKTLSAPVFGGLLVPDEYLEQLDALGWPWFDMLVGNFYELDQAAAMSDATSVTVAKATDVGGPGMGHATFKGIMLGSDRIVIEDPADYQMVLDWFRDGEPNRREFLEALAVKAEFCVARHLVASVNFHGKGRYFGLIGEVKIVFPKGENGHQSPGCFVETDPNDPFSFGKLDTVAGNPLSYNNGLDVKRLLRPLRRMAAAYDLTGRVVPKMTVVCKHNNACGAGIDWDDPIVALQKMIEGDNRAIFGGVMVTNFPIDDEMADVIRNHHLQKGEDRRILDGIIVPGISEGAKDLIERKTGNCRIVTLPALHDLDLTTVESGWDYVSVPGGFMIQPVSKFLLDFNREDLEFVGNRLTTQEEKDLIMAWAIGSSSCSNTITIVKDGRLLGNGVAQQDRVTACRLARDRARAMKHDLTGAAAYSDSFFPFPDAPMVLIRAGIKTIFASSGSKLGDGKVKAACQKYGLNLVRLPDEVCRGFQH